MNKVTINADLGKHTIDKNIYGHFSEHLGRCIYEGYWVAEDSPIPNTRGIRSDVVQALRRINPPVLRWPGGCFADEYHWMDGIGPRQSRPTMINTHWGGVTENNHFGTHEFMDLCEMIGAAPYICGNVGSGTVREMQQWVEYVTFDGVSPMADLRQRNGRDQPWKLPYFGIGNENWGCGGNMRPEFYADTYRRYRTYVRSFSGNKVFTIACGPCHDDYEWTEVLMRLAAPYMHGLALHYYTNPGEERSATQFTEKGWFTTLKNALFMEELVTRHGAVMDRYDPEKRVALVVDEWGVWYDVEPGTNPGFLYQQNTMRCALVAGLTLNIFNNHCDRVRMSNIAQTVNVLQSMILTEGAKMITTPTYHVFEMYKVHQDATLLPSVVEAEDCEFGGDSLPAVSASASRDAAGAVHVSFCNIDPKGERELVCKLHGMKGTGISGRILCAGAMNAHNTFNTPHNVVPVEFDGATLDGEGFTVTLPARSVVVLEVR